jgi:serine/threonine-protein kinase RsbW
MNPRHVSVNLILPNDLTEVRPVQDDIESALQTNQFGETDVFAIKLAVEEALVNAIKHGNQLDPEKKVRVGYSVDDERFRISISDEGPGFNPADVPDPTDEINCDRPCGRGVFLIKNFMTTVEYHGCGNTIVMTKDKSPDEPEE